MISPDEQKLIDRVCAWNPLWKERKTDKDKSFINPFSEHFDVKRAYELTMKGHIQRREFDKTYPHYRSADLPDYVTRWDKYLKTA